jgi:WD40 repeat protein
LTPRLPTLRKKPTNKFLNRRRFIAAGFGAAAIGGARFLSYAQDTAQTDRIAELKAQNAATQAAIKSRVLNSFYAHKAVTGALFAGGNKYLLSSGKDFLNPNEPSLKLWEISTGKNVITYAGHTGGTAAIAITKNGLHALSAGENDSSVKYWDLAKGTELRSFTLQSEWKGPAYLRAIAFSPDETRFAVAGSGLLRLYDLKSGAQIWDYKEIFQHDDIKSVAFTPDGSKLLATGNETRLVDVMTGRKIRSHKHILPNGSFQWATALAISPTGDTALFNDAQLTRIDLATGADQIIEHQNAVGIRAIAYSPDGTLALAGGEWTPLTLYDVKSGKPAFAFSTPGVSPFGGAVAIGPGGQIAAVGEARQGTLTFYDLSGIRSASA